jgi:hypothetical protein
MRVRNPFINHADHSASLADKRPNRKIWRNTFGARNVGKMTILMKSYEDGAFVGEVPSRRKGCMVWRGAGRDSSWGRFRSASMLEFYRQADSWLWRVILECREKNELPQRVSQVVSQPQ